MEQVQNLNNVWDNGATASSFLSGDAIDHFKSATNARKVIARRWIQHGNVHQTPYFVRLLTDKTGLVHYENNDPTCKRLIVVNADGTQRVVIGVPRVDANSRPKEGYLSLPPSSARFGGIEWGCEENDGYTDYLFDFDWKMGALLRYARPTRPC